MDKGGLGGAKERAVEYPRGKYRPLHPSPHQLTTPPSTLADWPTLTERRRPRRPRRRTAMRPTTTTTRTDHDHGRR